MANAEDADRIFYDPVSDHVRVRRYRLSQICSWNPPAPVGEVFEAIPRLEQSLG
jgi:hypothetical protein